MRVGFIGLGHMGSGMAANLVRAGHEVTVYNRSPAKAEALVALGAKAAASVVEACQGDVVITMLANDEAVESVVLGRDGIIASLPAGVLHVSSSTISIALSQRLAEEHAKASQRFVAAPVFGRPDVAAVGGLFVIVGGEPAAVEAATPLLEAIGQRTFVVSDTPKAANLVKLSGNFLIASMIESLGEAFALVAKGGVDQGRYLEILTSSLFDAPLYKTYGGLIASGVFEPAGFAAPLGQKDIRLALAAAEDLRVPMPVASLLRDRFLTLLAHGGDDPRLVGDRQASGHGCGRVHRLSGPRPRSTTLKRRRLEQIAIGRRPVDRDDPLGRGAGRDADRHPGVWLRPFRGNCGQGARRGRVA
jgi:3-hydroxyisobutyrate dehydrogenase-like beta-hydroxyacid dehydrogenase